MGVNSLAQPIIWIYDKPAPPRFRSLQTERRIIATLGQKAPIDTAHQPGLRACALDFTVEQSRPYSRRALQRGAPGGTRADPRGGTAPHAPGAQGQSAGGSTSRQRSGAPPLLSHCRQSDGRGPGDYPRGRMADRQLPCRGEADPQHPLRPASRLLPPAAQAC